MVTPFNIFGLSASDLLVWGIVLHLIADWPLQGDWMAKNKMKRRMRKPRRGNGITSPPRKYVPAPLWWDRHPAAYVHSFIQGACLAAIFGLAAIPLAIAHFIIDCRWVVEKWSKLVKQTQPHGVMNNEWTNDGQHIESVMVDVGLEVRFWTDQVFHIVCIAVAALLVTM